MAAVGLAAAVSAVAGAPAALATSETASSGAVTAQLDYRRQSPLVYSGLKVSIKREGRVLLTENPGRGFTRRAAPAGFGRGRSISVRDLDADGEPEILIKLYTGGAHCCFVGVVYRYAAGNDRYERTARNFLDAGYRLTDLDGTGGPEFLSADAGFASAFGSFADSRFPIAIISLEDSGFRDVTRSFPGRIRGDIRRQRREYERLRRNGNPRGAIAALVADQHLLGRPAAGERILRSALRRGDLDRSGKFDSPPYGRVYVRALRSLLQRLGYTSCGVAAVGPGRHSCAPPPVDFRPTPSPDPPGAAPAGGR